MGPEAPIQRSDTHTEALEATPTIPIPNPYRKRASDSDVDTGHLWLWFLVLIPTISDLTPQLELRRISTGRLKSWKRHMKGRTDVSGPMVTADLSSRSVPIRSDIEGATRGLPSNKGQLHHGTPLVLVPGPIKGRPPSLVWAPATGMFRPIVRYSTLIATEPPIWPGTAVSKVNHDEELLRRRSTTWLRW